MPDVRAVVLDVDERARAVQPVVELVEYLLLRVVEPGPDMPVSSGVLSDVLEVTRMNTHGAWDLLVERYGLDPDPRSACRRSGHTARPSPPERSERTTRVPRQPCPEGGQNNNDGQGDDGNAGAITVLDEDCRTEIGTVTEDCLDAAGDGGTELGHTTAPAEEEWVAWPISPGLAQDETESLTRAALIERYSTAKECR